MLRGPGREPLVQGTKKCLLSRHLVTLYFVNMFNHWKWAEEIFSGDLLILVEKNAALLLTFWVILSYVKALETNYQYTIFTLNIKSTLDVNS